MFCNVIGIDLSNKKLFFGNFEHINLQKIQKDNCEILVFEKLILIVCMCACAINHLDLNPCGNFVFRG